MRINKERKCVENKFLCYNKYEHDSKDLKCCTTASAISRVLAGV